MAEDIQETRPLEAPAQPPEVPKPTEQASRAEAEDHGWPPESQQSAQADARNAAQAEHAKATTATAHPSGDAICADAAPAVEQALPWGSDPRQRLRAMMSELRDNASVESAVDRPDVPEGAGERDGPTQKDEHAEMRKTVARQYADALGRPYEPPDDDDTGESGDQPSFDNVEIDKSKIAEYAMNPEHPKGQHKFRVINSTTGLTRTDVDQIEAQIRDGVRNGKPVAGKRDQHGQRWSVDVPITGPGGTMAVRTAWIVEPGSTTPRLATVSFPPKDK